MQNKLISILGCGWYGFPLAKVLISAGYSIKGSTTTTTKLPQFVQEGIQPYLINFDLSTDQYDPTFFKSEVLIICLPPKRGLNQHKEYPLKIRRIIAAAESGTVKKVLMISSTSVYPDVNREVNEEESALPETESGIAILEAEKIVKDSKSISSTILRFGGLIGPGRNLAKFFSGKKDIANGLAPVNLLHLEDCVRLTQHILITNSFGHTFNACSPDHPSREEMYSLVTKIMNIDSPHFLMQLDQWKIVNGNKVSVQLNFKYLVNNWSEFLGPDKL